MSLAWHELTRVQLNWHPCKYISPGTFACLDLCCCLIVLQNQFDFNASIVCAFDVLSLYLFAVSVSQLIGHTFREVYIVYRVRPHLTCLILMLRRYWKSSRSSKSR